MRVYRYNGRAKYGEVNDSFSLPFGPATVILRGNTCESAPLKIIRDVRTGVRMRRRYECHPERYTIPASLSY